MKMMTIRKIRELARKENNKRISKKAINKINSLLEKQLYITIRKAIRNADFAGRNTNKDEDIVD